MLSVCRRCSRWHAMGRRERERESWKSNSGGEETTAPHDTRRAQSKGTERSDSHGRTNNNNNAAKHDKTTSRDKQQRGGDNEKQREYSSNAFATILAGSERANSRGSNWIELYLLGETSNCNFNDTNRFYVDFLSVLVNLTNIQ